MDGVRRVAFVSERYLELQGLIPAAFGGGILLAAVMHQAFGGMRPADVTQVMLFGMLAGATPGSMFLHRSYKRTFGDVVATWQQKLLAALQTSVVSAGALVDMFRIADGHATGPSMAALALAAWSLAIVVRDWPWRAHHLVATAAGLAGAYATATSTAGSGQFGAASPGAPVYLLAYTLIGFALVVTGLFDHRLLVTALAPGATKDHRDVAPTSRSVAVVRTWIAAAVCGSAGLSLQVNPRLAGLSFSTALALTLCGIYGVTAVLQIVRGCRDFPRNVREPAMPHLRVDARASIAIGALAIAAAVQAALLAGRPPLLLAGAVAAACLFLACSDWRERRTYSLVSVAAVAAMPFMLVAGAARGFLVAVLAIAASFVVHGLAAWWRSFASGDAHADTV